MSAEGLSITSCQLQPTLLLGYDVNPFAHPTPAAMIDIKDFDVDAGGDPEKIRESQRTRFASVEVVDEIIALYKDSRASESPFPAVATRRALSHANEHAAPSSIATYDLSQLNQKINEVQKQIGPKKKVAEPMFSNAPLCTRLRLILPAPGQGGRY